MTDTGAVLICPTCATPVWIRWDPDAREGKCQNKHMVMSDPATGELYNPNIAVSLAWTINDSASRVLDALAIWLEKHTGWRYVLERHEDYLEKKWKARLVHGQPRYEGGDGGVSVNGRGNTAHEATVEMFNLADVPRT